MKENILVKFGHNYYSCEIVQDLGYSKNYKTHVATVKNPFKTPGMPEITAFKRGQRWSEVPPPTGSPFRGKGGAEIAGHHNDDILNMRWFYDGIEYYPEFY